MSPPLLTAACSLVLVVVACTGNGEDGAARPRVAVIQDGTFPDALSVVSPSVLGLQISLGDAAEMVVLDTGGTGGEEAVAEVAADPAVVAAVIAPFTRMSEGAMGSLAASGMPILSLSSGSPSPPVGSPWREAVPPESDEASVLARRAEKVAAGGTVCLAGEATAWSEGLRELLGLELSGASVRAVGGTPAAAGAAARADCSVAIWTGSAQAGAEFRTELGASTPLLLASSARTEGYLEATGPIEGIQLGACPCTDTTTSAAEGIQAFVHDYQAETGLEPGPFALEGYDLGRLLAGLVATSGDRAGLSVAIAGLSSFAGIANTYRWDGEGDLLAPGVRMYQATGMRWLAERSPPPP